MQTNMCVLDSRLQMSDHTCNLMGSHSGKDTGEFHHFVSMDVQGSQQYSTVLEQISDRIQFVTGSQLLEYSQFGMKTLAHAYMGQIGSVTDQSQQHN